MGQRGKMDDVTPTTERCIMSDDRNWIITRLRDGDVVELTVTYDQYLTWRHADEPDDVFDQLEAN